jgi:hypothetical protein
VQDPNNVSNGIYTAPLNIPNPDTVMITAVSHADPTKSATTSLTITPAVTVTIDPMTVTLMAGQSQQFIAHVNNTDNQMVTWSLMGDGCMGSGCGMITSGGLYTAPMTLPSPPTVTVIATSVEFPDVSGTATVTLSQNTQLGISILPNMPAPVMAGSTDTITFTAVIQNAPPDTTVTWQLGCNSKSDDGDFCTDTDFDGDGPGCTLLQGGLFKICGVQPDQGKGDLSLTYYPPTTLKSGKFQANVCTTQDGPDGIVPLNISITYNGQLAQAYVCISVIPSQ